MRKKLIKKIFVLFFLHNGSHNGLKKNIFLFCDQTVIWRGSGGLPHFGPPPLPHREQTKTSLIRSSARLRHVPYVGFLHSTRRVPCGPVQNVPMVDELHRRQLLINPFVGTFMLSTFRCRSATPPSSGPPSPARSRRGPLEGPLALS